VRSTRYTAWDGTQRVRLDPERLFERMADALSSTDDVSLALEWLLRQGIDLGDVQVMGLDELEALLRDALRSREERFHLRNALDEPRNRLEEVLRRERETLENLVQKGDPSARAREKRALLDDLPARLSQAIERLAQSYSFEDPVAARDFADLLEDLDRIRRVEELERRWGDRLRGPEALDFAGALELAEEIDALLEIESLLGRGDLEGVDLARLAALLGARAASDLSDLRRAVLLLQDAGYLTARGGRVELSAKGIRRIGQLALRDIYQSLLRDRAGPHETSRNGAAEIVPGGIRPYKENESLSLALVPTLMQAIQRLPESPVALEPEDFLVHDAVHATTTSTVLLLDMSWSMSWEGRFAAAKKVALALESLIRTRYPRDYFGVVGFYTRAVELRPQDLAEATWNMGDPFTNLQDGLRLGAQMLRRHPSRNQHLIVVTDGQPTAYFSGGVLHREWPLSFGGVSRRAAQETLREVERVTRRRITINTFMLDDSPGLRAFVEQMTRINRGRALYSRPDRLGQYLLVDYLARKRRRV
jgi:uncharacterized protein with von Willebrand factor type A (vWA) domain